MTSHGNTSFFDKDRAITWPINSKSSLQTSIFVADTIADEFRPETKKPFTLQNYIQKTVSLKKKGFSLALRIHDHEYIDSTCMYSTGLLLALVFVYLGVSITFFDAGLQPLQYLVDVHGDIHTKLIIGIFTIWIGCKPQTYQLKSDGNTNEIRFQFIT